MRIAALVGPHVALRPPAWRDRRAFLEMVRASRVLHRGWVSPPGDLVTYTAWLRRLRGDRHAAFLAVRRTDAAIAGVVSLNEIVHGAFQSAYLGYYANARLAGAGYMREALALALEHAFGPLGLHRIEANIQPGNRSSLALARSLGFRREGFSPRYLEVAGRWRDHDRFALLREEWQRGGKKVRRRVAQDRRADGR